MTYTQAHDINDVSPWKPSRMILDFNELTPDTLSATLSADVCVVGAGAAGITLALNLANSGLDVLVLESGGEQDDAATQALYQGSVSDEHLHSPPDRYRQRRFGGSTTIWGGRCMPFDPIDFEQRDFIPDSGWPIEHTTLLPFYGQANRLCEAGHFSYTAEEAFVRRPMRPMIENFDSPHFTTNTLERFSCPTDFGARYGERLRAATKVRVLLHANVVKIQLHTDGRNVQSVDIASLQGRTATVKARRFVLSVGGIETARLLLANRDVHAAGIGNTHDVVGRYYMCHIAGTVGVVRLNRPISSIWHGYDVSDEGIYCRRRLALRPEMQRALGIGNVVARLHHPRITLPEHRNAMLSMLYLAKPVIPYEYAKRLHGDEKGTFKLWFAHAWNVCRDPFDAFGFAWHMLRDRKLSERKFPSIIFHPKAPIFSLDFHAEQEPTPSSRITLAEERDALGVPRVNIDWHYTQGDVSTVKKSLALLAADLQNTGTGSFEYDPDSLEFEMTRYGAYGGHHIGTARMGTDPRTSVVNADCRLHDVANLYVAGSAVFPTSSQANPTLTIVAMALRLADHLKRELI